MAGQGAKGERRPHACSSSTCPKGQEQRRAIPHGMHLLSMCAATDSTSDAAGGCVQPPWHLQRAERTCFIVTMLCTALVSLHTITKSLPRMPQRKSCGPAGGRASQGSYNGMAGQLPVAALLGLPRTGPTAWAHAGGQHDGRGSGTGHAATAAVAAACAAAGGARQPSGRCGCACTSATADPIGQAPSRREDRSRRAAPSPFWPPCAPSPDPRLLQAGRSPVSSPWCPLASRRLPRCPVRRSARQLLRSVSIDDRWQVPAARWRACKLPRPAMPLSMVATGRSCRLPARLAITGSASLNRPADRWPLQAWPARSSLPRSPEGRSSCPTAAP